MDITSSSDHFVPSTPSTCSSQHVTPVAVTRIADYKRRGSLSTQEDRRRKLLEEQKKRRSDCFNERRGLLDELIEHEDETEDRMECSEIKAKKARRYCVRVMLSEWLVEVPSDLDTHWYMVPCPEGKRRLIVAAKGVTKSFTKQGYLIDVFPSALPGGHTYGNVNFRSQTVLDCVWSAATQTFYILDLLAWNNQPMIECEAEFRFYWLESKLPEIEGLSEVSSKNSYHFSLLPHYSCHPVTLTTVMATYPFFPSNVPNLDGLLFYHSQAHYTYGSTPLFGWLKPFMLADILNIPVAEEYYTARPEGYQDIQQYIEQTLIASKLNQNKRRRRKKRRKLEKMETDVECEG